MGGWTCFGADTTIDATLKSCLLHADVQGKSIMLLIKSVIFYQQNNFIFLFQLGWWLALCYCSFPTHFSWNKWKTRKFNSVEMKWIELIPTVWMQKDLMLRFLKFKKYILPFLFQQLIPSILQYCRVLFQGKLHILPLSEF